jgi:hypothetical protein
MARLLGAVAEPAAAAWAIEMEFFLLHGRPAASVDYQADKGRKEDDGGHNANCEGIVHGSAFLVSHATHDRNEKKEKSVRTEDRRQTVCCPLFSVRFFRGPPLH